MVGAEMGYRREGWRGSGVSETLTYEMWERFVVVVSGLGGLAVIYSGGVVVSGLS